MNANDYQYQAARTLIAEPDAEYTPEELMLVWNALGLAGEAGEVADLIKKSVFHRHALDRTKLVKELGDVLWYVAALCTKLGIHMDDVMAANIEKLRQRYPAGYSSEASKHKPDELGSEFAALDLVGDLSLEDRKVLVRLSAALQSSTEAIRFMSLIRAFAERSIWSFEVAAESVITDLAAGLSREYLTQLLTAE